MKYKIQCSSWTDDNGVIEREWEINSDGKMWPCNHFVGESMRSAQRTRLRHDPAMNELLNRDPNWNNTNNHDIADIINHPYYQTQVHPTGWNGDNPIPMCAHFCGKAIKDNTDNIKIKNL